MRSMLYIFFFVHFIICMNNWKWPEKRSELLLFSQNFYNQPFFIRTPCVKVILNGSLLAFENTTQRLSAMSSIVQLFLI